MHGSSSRNWPQMSLTTTIYKLSTAQRFSYFLMARHQTWNNYHIYVYEMDFSDSSINFVISMRSFSFTKITIRLSKWLELKMALVLFSQSYVTPSWIVYSCTTGHADMIFWWNSVRGSYIFTNFRWTNC